MCAGAADDAAAGASVTNKFIFCLWICLQSNAISKLCDRHLEKMFQIQSGESVENDEQKDPKMGQIYGISTKLSQSHLFSINACRELIPGTIFRLWF